VSCGAGSVGRLAAGADPGSSPPPAVWLCAAVLRVYIYMMPLSTGPLPRAWTQLVVDCVLLLGGGAGAGAGRLRMSCAVGSPEACNRGQPSLTSASTSGLSSPVLPRQLCRVVSWVGFLLDVIGGVERVVWGVTPH
jgi:hypothetical protein